MRQPVVRNALPIWVCVERGVAGLAPAGGARAALGRTRVRDGLRRALSNEVCETPRTCQRSARRRELGQSERRGAPRRHTRRQEPFFASLRKGNHRRGPAKMERDAPCCTVRGPQAPTVDRRLVRPSARVHFFRHRLARMLAKQRACLPPATLWASGQRRRGGRRRGRGGRRVNFARPAVGAIRPERAPIASRDVRLAPLPPVVTYPILRLAVEVVSGATAS